MNAAVRILAAVLLAAGAAATVGGIVALAGGGVADGWRLVFGLMGMELAVLLRRLSRPLRLPAVLARGHASPEGGGVIPTFVECSRQEFLQGGWFQDTVSLDWHLNDEFRGIVRLYRDLVHLRLNRAGHSRGLCGRGIRVHHVNERADLLAFHRWDNGGPGDDVMVVANFENQPRGNYAIGFPRPGLWRSRLNSEWPGSSDDFGDFASRDVTATAQDCDGCAARGSVEIGPYSLLILSQDP